MAIEVKIERQTEESAIDENGRPAVYVVTDFMVGPDGPFRERMRKSEFSAQAMRAQIERFAAEIARLRQ